MQEPRTDSREPAAGLIAAAFAAIGWGFAGVFGRLTSVSGIVLTFYRTWFSAIVFAALMLVSRRPITWRLLRISSFGGLFLAADMALFFSAIKLTSVAIATVISALQPVLIILAAGPLLGEKRGPRDILWTVVAICGVGVIVVGAGIPSHDEVLGDLLAVGSLLSWSAYFVVSKRASIRLQALEYTTGVTIMGAIVLTVVLAAFGQTPTKVHAEDWLWLALLALVPGLAHLLMNWAHHRVSITVASVIGSANPVVAAAAGYTILGQRLTTVQIAGGAVGVAAIAVVAASRRPTSPLLSP